MGSDHNLHGFYNSTGLELGLGSYEYQPDQDHDQEINKKRSLITMSLKCDHLLPSDLTLGPISSSSDHHQSSPVSTEKSADTILHRQASSLSAVSSFSNSSASTTVVKRDREVISGELEVETNLERSLVSPRVISGSISDVNNQIIEDDSVLDQGSPRKKLRLTKQQSALLEDSFKEHTTLNPKQKQDLAKQLNLRPRQVEVWFQNRRARTKLKQTEADYEQWKKCCEALTEENKRLQKELQELKSLKLITAPFYMQYPTPASAAPATLTICPSCERLGRGGGGDSSGRVLIRPKATHLISNSYTTTTQHPSEAAC